MKLYWKQSVSALKFLVLALVLTGLVYSFALLGISRLFFPVQADGSLTIGIQGKTSLLAGENFRDAGHLWGRLQKQQAVQKEDGSWYVVGVPANSDTGSPEYQAQKAQRMQQIAAANPDAAGPVPEELVTYSGSGNDPDLSLDAALWQVPRIAAARDMDEVTVEEIIRENVNPTVFSEKTVSVVRVNLALDGQE